MSRALPDFRPGNVLATRFTGTLSERLGEQVERLPSAERLVDWLAANGLAVSTCDTTELTVARELREAVHTALTAVVLGDELPGADVDTINACGADGRGSARLTPDGRRQWWLGPEPAVRDALRVVAADAISVIARERDGRLARCASPTCGAVFLDTSQSRTRKWCDMNTCGNRRKKARLKARS